MSDDESAGRDLRARLREVLALTEKATDDQIVAETADAMRAWWQVTSTPPEPPADGDLFEALAAKQHEIWAHWMRYLLGAKGKREITGDVVLRDADVQHWWRQIKTPYAELAEAEKESDREQVRKFWPLLAERPAWPDSAEDTRPPTRRRLGENDAPEPDGTEDGWADTPDGLIVSALGLICNVDGSSQGWRQSDEWVEAADRWLARYGRVRRALAERPAEPDPDHCTCACGCRRPTNGAMICVWCWQHDDSEPDPDLVAAMFDVLENAIRDRGATPTHQYADVERMAAVAQRRIDAERARILGSLVKLRDEARARDQLDKWAGRAAGLDDAIAVVGQR